MFLDFTWQYSRLTPSYMLKDYFWSGLRGEIPGRLHARQVPFPLSYFFIHGSMLTSHFLEELGVSWADQETWRTKQAWINFFLLILVSFDRKRPKGLKKILTIQNPQKPYPQVHQRSQNTREPYTGGPVSLPVCRLELCQHCWIHLEYSPRSQASNIFRLGKMLEWMLESLR